jgi:hypothetical protein
VFLKSDEFARFHPDHLRHVLRPLDHQEVIPELRRLAPQKGAPMPLVQSLPSLIEYVE